MELLIRDNSDRHRYEALEADEVVGIAAYRLGHNVVTFTRTEIDAEHEGEGIAGTLVRYALDDVRSRDVDVVAECPFVRGWIDRHPDYADLLA